ncbi:MAG: CHAD domain-containing protein [Candidatus Tyrphobacter sp.]
MRVGAFLHATLSGYVEDFSACDLQLERGSADPEIVHDARVAVRRLRSALRTFEAALDPGWARNVRETLRGLSDELSEARDADVMVERMRAALADIDPADRPSAGEILALFEQRRREAYDRIAAARRSREYGDVMRALQGAAEPPVLAARAADRARTLIVPVLEDVYKRLRKRVRRCGPGPSDEALHAVRIAAKHLRYALEALAPIDMSAPRRLAKRVVRLQDVLGEEHDAAGAARRLREFSADPKHAFAAGAIAAVERRAVAKARSSWLAEWHGVERCMRRERKRAPASVS